MPTRLFLTRHGESTVNVLHLASDDHENNPLTAVGRSQAIGLAAELAGSGIDRVYTSPTQRARETGEIVADRLHRPRAIEWGLEEIRVGVHEGEQGQVALDRGVVDFRRWLAEEDLGHAYVEGESGFDVVRRASAALRRIVERHDGETLLVVSHGGALAMTVPMLCDNITLRSLHTRQLDHCGLVEIDVDGDEWTCRSWMGEDPSEFVARSVA